MGHFRVETKLSLIALDKTLIEDDQRPRFEDRKILTVEGVGQHANWARNVDPTNDS